MKYLVTYEGVVTGSLAGRDDGYPMIYSVVVDSLAEAGKYADKKDFQAYQCEPLSTEFVVKKKQQSDTAKEIAKATAERTKELALFQHLKEKYQL